MKENNRLRKIRVLKIRDAENLIGLSLPSHLNRKWEGVLVKIIESGNCLVLESGAKASSINQKDLIKVTTKITEIII